MKALIQNKKYVFLLFCVVVVAIGLLAYIRYGYTHPATDDAYVNAHIVEISTQVSGQVQHVYVSDHQFVKKGQLLFELDQRPFSLALQKAQADLLNVRQQIRSAVDRRNAAAASLEQAQANWTLAKTTFSRYETLYMKHYLAKQSLDEQHNQLVVSKAAMRNAQQQLQEVQDEIGTQVESNSRIVAAELAVKQALLNLNYTKVYAPISGDIAQFSLHSGDSVSALQTVFSLIDNKNMWVDAHFKETQIGSMHVGMPVQVKIDMYPGKTFQGKIDSIAYGSGDSFSILPSENDSGNWVKVTQRFTVKIDMLNAGTDYPLRVGSSASVKVHLS